MLTTSVHWGSVFKTPWFLNDEFRKADVFDGSWTHSSTSGGTYQRFGIGFAVNPKTTHYNALRSKCNIWSAVRRLTLRLLLLPLQLIQPCLVGRKRRVGLTDWLTTCQFGMRRNSWVWRAFYAAAVSSLCCPSTATGSFKYLLYWIAVNHRRTWQRRLNFDLGLLTERLTGAFWRDSLNLD